MNKLPWIMAGMWFAARIIAGKMMEIGNAKNFGVLSNILLILILIFLAIYYRYRNLGQNTSSFFEDLKECMKPALKYVLAAVALIGLYYGVLSNDLQTLREAHVQAFNEGILVEENLTKFRAEHPELKDYSVEQLMQANKENVERNASLHINIIGALLALTFVSLAYSLLAVLIWRVMVKRL
jgi:hypothetical protein